MAKKPFYYGGQAVLEGVMMRGAKHYGIAVRQENKEISITVKGLSNVYSGRVRKIPFVRGIVALVETLIIGVRALIYSADVFMGEEEVKGKSSLLWLSLLVGIALAIGLFIGIPLLITEFAVKPHITSNVLFNVINGLIRLVIIIAYMWGIGYMKDIRRVFAYHGAEHKTINAYEDGAALEVADVKKYSTAHPRCGTSFLLVIMVLAIVAYMFIGRPAWYLRFAYQLALLPAIAAVSYEIIRLSARCYKNRIVKALLVPGMFLQKLTTREPDDEQLEVGITALKIVLDAEQAQAAGEGNV
ncbi:DUF1385 domain-containing protein [Chloroflexota bacterium]